MRRIGRGVLMGRFNARKGQTIDVRLPSSVAARGRGNRAVFALNRHLTEEMELRVELRGLGAARAIDHALALHHRDLSTTNRVDAPDAVVPQANPHVAVEGESMVARLKPASWNVIVTTAAPR